MGAKALSDARQLLAMGMYDRLSEKTWQALVREEAVLQGWKVFCVYDSRRSPEGYPDLTLCRLSRVEWAELKSEKGKLSPAQREWIAALELAGRKVHVWRPSDHERVCEILR